MNLGTERQEPVPAPTQTEEGPSYPSFAVRNEKMEELCKECEMDVGDEVTATVKLKVSGKNDNEFGKDMSFKVMELNDIKKSGGEHDESEEHEDKSSKSDYPDNPAIEKLMASK